MVYKKFIKRDGQLFGPYYYESYRDSSGKVKTKYLPDYSETDFPLSKNSSGPTKKFIFISIAITIALLFVIFASLFVLQTNYNFENSTTGVGKSAHNFASTFNSLIGRAVDDLGIDNSPTSTEEASTPESDASVETPASSEALLETTPVVEEVITLPQEEAPVEPITPGIDASVEIPTSEPSSDSSTSSENQTISEPLAEENQTSTILENNSIQETLNDTILPVNSGSNLTLENNSIQETIISNDSSATLQVSVKQYGAVLGKPVKWEKKVRVDAANGIGINNLEISLPYLAENISVINRNSVNGQENEVNNLEILDSEGNTLEGKQSSVDLISGGITGNVISARGNNNAIYRFFKSIEKFFKNIFSFSITGRAIDSNLQVSGDNITVQINEQIADNNLVTIEYETVAPYAEEIMIDGGKEVTIIGPDEVHYKDILAFSELSSEISSSSLIKFYWINETTGNGQEVSFEAKDYNDNGLIDTIEWVVPHLSSQRYIILGGGGGGGFTNVIEMKPFGPNFLVPEHLITSCSVEFAVYPLFVSDFCLVSFNNFQTNYTLNQYNATYFNTTVLFNFPNGNYDYKFWCQNESVVNNTKGNYFTLSSIASCSAFQGGDGTAGNPYQIASWAHLNNTRNNLTASYILVNDLSSLGQGYAGIGNNWRPIGVASQFEGVFDGGNHTISDLIMGLPFNSTTGLFGVLKGNISNLGLINVNISGSTYVGSFVGDNRGTISRSYATGKINGSITLGGLVGINWGNISNSYSLVNVTGDLVVAGLVGENYGIITDSYSAGKITNSTNMNIGGLVGTEGRVINSFWDINASGQKTSFNGTGKTTLEMKNISTLGAWDISSSLTDLNDGYPYLAWQAANGAHVWSIYSNSSGQDRILPTVLNFATRYGSTNFSVITDIFNVTNLTLANVYGKIQFSSAYSVNASAQDYDASVVIGNGFVSVNASALNSTFNSSVNITINGVNCPAVVYTGANVYSSAAGILNEKTICSDCVILDCIGGSNGNLTFQASHFSGYAGIGDANLTIWDQNDTAMPFANRPIYPNTQINFFANYTNNSFSLSASSCNICFNDSGLCTDMIENSTTGLYDYNRTFSLIGTYSWNSTCNKTGYETLTAFDNLFIPDLMSPNITILAPANYSIISNQTFNFTANVSDSGSGLANATIYIYNQTGLYNQTTINLGGVFQATIGIPVFLVEGIYTWFWQVFDLANNFVSTATQVSVGNQTLIVDANPTVNLTYPANGFVSVPNDINLNCSAASDVNLTNLSFYTNVSGVWNVSDYYLYSDSPFNLTNAVLYLRMDESSWNGTSGQIKDVLGLKNGTSYNSANTTDGLLRRAGTFNATAISYIKLPSSSIKGQSRVSISMWIKPINGFGILYEEVVNVNEDTRLKLRADSSKIQMSFQAPDGGGYTTFSSSNSVNLNKWNYVVAVFDSVADVHHLYLNGVDTSYSAAAGAFNNNDPFSLPVIGARSTLTNPFHGSIDEVIIFNRALSASEINNEYHRRAAGINVTESLVLNTLNIGSYNWNCLVNDNLSRSSTFWQNYSFSISTNAYLAIQDDTSTVSKYVLQNVNLHANYTNASSGVSITDASCNLTFADRTLFVVYNSTSGVYDYNRTFSSSGDYTYSVRCNKTGYDNVTKSGSVSISSDTIASNITILTPANATITNNQTINFTANLSDSGSGLANATIYIYNQTGLYNQTTINLGGVFQTIVGIPVFLVEGIYTWFWQIYDLANNFVSTATQADAGNYTLSIDTSNPMISITYPVNGSIYEQNITSLNYTLSYTGPAEFSSCWYTIDGGFTNTTVTCGQNITSLSATDGWNTWRVYVNDTARNVNSSSVTFYSTYLTNCGNLSQPGRYNLMNNISTDGHCFNITADNIIFNLNGYTVSGDTIGNDYGIYAKGRNNISVINGTISLFGKSINNGRAIFFSNTNSSHISSLIFSENQVGIYLDASSNGNFSDLSFILNYDGLNLNSASNNNFFQNISFVDTSAGGIKSYSSSNNAFSNINITQSSSISAAILLSTSQNNTFAGVDLSFNGYGVSFDSSLNNTFYNLNSYSNTNQEIVSFDWVISVNNILTYNNSFGEIKFRYLNADVNGELRFGDGYNLQINNNSAYLNSSALPGLNIPANVTLRGVGDRGYSIPAIKKDNLPCTNCYNFTSLNADTVIFNVSGWSNYTVGDISQLTITACGVLNLPNTVYLLLNNVTGGVGNCFNITADNITLNGNGFNIRGPGTCGAGIYANGRNNITIRNFANISKYLGGFDSCFGIHFVNTNNSIIENVGIYENSAGILMDHSSRNLISATQIRTGPGADGLILDSSSNNIFNNLNASGNFAQIYSDNWAGATGNVLRYNNSFGEIKFSYLNGDVYNDLIFGNGQNIQISNNLAYLNSASLPELSIPANVSLYNLPTNFLHPSILKDGALCGNACYNFTSLNAGNVTFNVTSWSNYSIAEDFNAPNITILAPANATITNNQTINFTANLSDVGGLANATISIYNQTGLYNQTTIQLGGVLQRVVGIPVFLVEGVYTWFWQVFDLANNFVSTATQVGVGNYTLSIDTSNPMISIVYPVNGTIYEEKVTALNYTVTYTGPADLSSCWYSTNNGITNTTITCGQNITSLNGTNGWNTWRVYVNDTARNVNSSRTTFYSTYFTNCSNLDQVNHNYYLGNNITKNVTCFNITADNITFEGNAFTLQGSPAPGGDDAGIFVNGRKNVTIQNIRVQNFTYQISFNNTNNSLIKDSNFGPRNSNIFRLFYSNLNTLQNNTITISTQIAIPVFGLYWNSNNNTLVSNRVTFSIIAPISSHTTFMIFNSSYNTFSNNYINSTVSGTVDGFSVNYNSDYNNFSNNIYLCSDTFAAGRAFIFNSLAPNSYPENNIIQNNSLYTQSAQKQLYFLGSSINGTRLIDQSINGFNFTYGAGSMAFTSSRYGEVKFLSPVNGSGFYLISNDSNRFYYMSGATLIYIDTAPLMRLGNNSIFVNSTSQIGLNQIGLNRSANITLTGLRTNFVHPDIYRDGVICNVTTIPACYNFTSLNAGTVIFNVTSWSNYTIADDSLAPNITLLTPANATITNNTNLNFTANLSDSGSGIANATIYIYNQTGLYNQTTINLGGVTQTTVGVVIYLVEGIYTWFWQVYDLANNFVSTATQAGVGNYTLSVDTSSSMVRIVYPAINDLKFNLMIGINYTTSFTGPAQIASCWYYNTTGGRNSLTCGNNITGVTLMQGINNVTIYANDTAGNTNSSFRNFTVDTIAPAVNILFPTVSSYNYHNLTLNFSVSDATVGLDTCMKSLNGGTNYTISCTQNSTVNSSSQGTIEGLNTITLYANDTVGNMASSSITFTIGTGVPAIQLQVPLEFENLSSRNVNFSYHVVDSHGVDTCELWTNLSGAWAKNYTWASIVNDTDNSFVVNSIADGSYQWNVKCNDTLNNIAWHTNNHTFTLDTINPAVNITYPINGTVYEQKISTLNYTASDLRVANCWYSTNNGVTNTTIACGQNITGLNGTDGWNTWRIYVNDSAGNVNSSRTTFYSTYLTTCGNLSQPGTYVLQNNIFTNRTCFNISTNNMVLDGNGYNLTGDGVGIDYGIVTSGRINLTVKNFKNISLFFGGISFSYVNNSFVYNNTISLSNYSFSSYRSNNNIFSLNNIYNSLTANDGFYLIESHNNSLINNFMNTARNSHNIALWASNSNYIFNNTLITVPYGEGIVLVQMSSNNSVISNSLYNWGGGIDFYSFYVIDNLLLNNNFFNISGPIFGDSKNNLNHNYLIYNNSYGQIKWTSNTLLDNLTIYGTNLILGQQVVISDNYVYLNSTAFTGNINTSANVSLYNLPTNMLHPIILKDGRACIDCYNFTDLNAGNVVFNVTSWSNYSIADNTSPGITGTIVINQTGSSGGNTARGDNVTIDATIIDTETSVQAAWVTVWQNVIGGPILLVQYLQNLFGNIWSTTFATNGSFNLGQVNYTIYANDTSGLVSNLSGNFSLTRGVKVYDCFNITLPGTYVLQNNITTNTTCFTISADNVVLNLNGFNVTGDNSGKDYGVYSAGRNNLTVKNGVIQWFGREVLNSYGIYFVDINNSVIQNIILSNNGYGLGFDLGSGNNVYDLKSTLSGWDGISLWSILNSNFYNVSTTLNDVDGLYSTSGLNNSFYNFSSTANGGNGLNIYLDLETNFYSLISNANNLQGISLDSCSNNTFFNLTTSGNGQDGITLGFSSSNIFYNFTSSQNTWNSLTITSSSNNTFYSINAVNNTYGVYLTTSSNNTFYNINSTLNTWEGIYLGLGSNNNRFYAPHTYRNNYGIYLSSSHNNSFNNLESYSNANSEIYSDNWASATSNVLLYNNSFGEIKFSQLVLDIDGGHNLTFPGNIIVASNLAYFNSSAIPELNVSANVSLYNLPTNMLHPVILKDGRACIDCYNFTDLNAGNVVFNVSSWSNYSILDDSLAANITILLPANASITNNTIINFTINVSDNAGLGSAVLNIYNQTGLYNQTTVQLGGVLQTVVGIPVFLVEGIYTWFWQVFDLAGNSANTQTSEGNRSLTIDTTPSSISIITPQNTVYSNGTILVNITANDPHLESIWFNWNGTNQVYTSPFYVMFAEGNNTLRAYANDSAGNINSTSVNFTVTTPYCGDGVCNNGEACDACIADCGTCGSGCTQVDGGWSAWSTCSFACTQTRSCNSPVPSCGGSSCSGLSSQTCTGGSCPPICIPSCIGKTCGNDGCGGSCGTCSPGSTCNVDQCVLDAECTVNSDCVDGNACTDDICSNGQCSYVANTASCNADNNLCTIDACSAGACRAGTPKSCDDNVACSVDSCDAFTGQCQNVFTSCSCTMNSQCNDNNVCTDDSCSSNNCVQTYNTNSCNDGNARTENDKCSSGVCSGTNIACPDGYVWDSSVAQCVQGAPPVVIPVDVVTIRTDCTTNFACGEWSACAGSYDVTQIINGNTLQGTMERVCKDLGDCKSSFSETKTCLLKSEITIKREIWCGEEYINLVDSTGQVTSRMKLSQGKYQAAKISLNLEGNGYCAYCFDGVKNYDEEGVDCGGSCAICNDQKLSLTKTPWLRNLVFILILAILIMGVLIGIVLVYRRNQELRELDHLVRKYKIWKAKGYDADVVKTYLGHIKKGS